MLYIISISPVLAAILAVIVLTIVKLVHLRKPRAKHLVRLSIKYAAVGAGASLVVTIGWMIWYEKTTGFGAANAPLGWIFFYGPLSATLGQLAALARWWFATPN